MNDCEINRDELGILDYAQHQKIVRSDVRLVF